MLYVDMCLQTEVAMTITTLSSREFNQDASGAKRAASKGPVFVTDRGRPAHVLLTIEDYQRLTGEHMSLLKALEHGGTEADFKFEPPGVEGLNRPADLD
jgi:prevent-host-death family protein